MRLYKPRQRLVKVYGRGIGDAFKDLVTSDLFKGSLKTIGRLGLDGLKTAKNLAIEKLGPILSQLGTDALGAAKDFGIQQLDTLTPQAVEFIERESGKAVMKGLDKLDKKIGAKNTGALLDIAGVLANSEAAQEVKGKLDKKLKLPATLKKPVKNLGDALKQSISNATDSDGVRLANVDEIIKEPDIIKALPDSLFQPSTNKEVKIENIGSLLSGSGRQKKKAPVKKKTPVNKGNGLFLPGTFRGTGIAYV